MDIKRAQASGVSSGSATLSDYTLNYTLCNFDQKGKSPAIAGLLFTHSINYVVFSTKNDCGLIFNKALSIFVEATVCHHRLVYWLYSCYVKAHAVCQKVYELGWSQSEHSG